MRRLASHVSRSKRADKRWTKRCDNRPTPLNYGILFERGHSLPLSLFLSSVATTRPLFLFFISHSSLPAIIPRFIKARTDVNERGNCSLASFHCVAFHVLSPFKRFLHRQKMAHGCLWDRGVYRLSKLFINWTIDNWKIFGINFQMISAIIFKPGLEFFKKGLRSIIHSLYNFEKARKFHFSHCFRVLFPLLIHSLHSFVNE